MVVKKILTGLACFGAYWVIVHCALCSWSMASLRAILVTWPCLLVLTGIEASTRGNWRNFVGLLVISFLLWLDGAQNVVDLDDVEAFAEFVGDC